MSGLRASGHYLVVTKSEVADRIGSLLLPANATSPTLDVVVTSVGDLAETNVEVGEQVIVYPNTLSAPIKAGGKDYHIVKDEHVLAVRS